MFDKCDCCVLYNLICLACVLRNVCVYVCVCQREMD